MPCNCSGIRMRKCSCKLVEYPLKCRQSSSVVLVSSTNGSWFSRPRISSEKQHFVYSLIESVYDKCAAYNLRHCPLRGSHSCDQHLVSVARHLMIILCFLVANSVVLLTLTAKMTAYLYLFLRETILWIKGSALKSECNKSIRFQPLDYKFNHITTSSTSSL